MITNRHKRLVLAMVLAMVLPGTGAFAESWGPWSTDPAAPVLQTAADREQPPRPPREPAVHSIAGTPFLWMLKFYQRTITRVDGDRCPMYPTCSQYSVQAIHRHGPVLGIVMTADRLMHEIDEQAMVPLIRVGDRYRFDDPVSNNDFWWYHE